MKTRIHWKPRKTKIDDLEGETQKVEVEDEAHSHRFKMTSPGRQPKNVTKSTAPTCS
jgi:hypothetical protein